MSRAVALSIALVACHALPVQVPAPTVRQVPSPPPPPGVPPLLPNALSPRGLPMMDVADQRDVREFQAYSVGGDNGLGGHAKSDNLPQSMDVLAALDIADLMLIAMPEESRSFVAYDHHHFGISFDGFRVVLANGSTTTRAFDASDSSLPIVQEALDADGVWRPIEYQAESSCGNSFHTLELEPGEYWDFTAPRYHGAVATSLRFTLTISLDHRVTTLHSAPFAGSINVSQFVEHERAW